MILNSIIFSTVGPLVKSKCICIINGRNIYHFQLTEKLIVPTLTEPGDIEIFENEDAIIRTTASGKPQPSVEWFQGFAKLRKSKQIDVRVDDNQHTLQLKECKLRDSGTITAVATNKAGTCTVESALLVKGGAG